MKGTKLGIGTWSNLGYWDTIPPLSHQCLRVLSCMWYPSPKFCFICICILYHVNSNRANCVFYLYISLLSLRGTAAQLIRVSGSPFQIIFPAGLSETSPTSTDHLHVLPTHPPDKNITTCRDSDKNHCSYYRWLETPALQTCSTTMNHLHVLPLTKTTTYIDSNRSCCSYKF